MPKAFSDLTDDECLSILARIASSAYVNGLEDAQIREELRIAGFDHEAAEILWVTGRGIELQAYSPRNTALLSEPK